MHHFFLLIDMGNLVILAESSLSLVSKTTFKPFFVRFSYHTGQVFVLFFENLTRVTWKPDQKKGLKVVLDTRDNEDSSTMFRFPVSTHKKKWWAFEKISQKFGPIWRFFRFETTVTGVEELKWTKKKMSSIKIGDLIKEDGD